MPRILASFYQEELEAIIDDLEHVQEVESDVEEEDEERIRTNRNRRIMINYLKVQFMHAVRLGCSKEKELELQSINERIAAETRDMLG